jgi:hypothetical protein
MFGHVVWRRRIPIAVSEQKYQGISLANDRSFVQWKEEGFQGW